MNIVEYKKRKNNDLFDGFKKRLNCTNIQNYIPVYNKFFTLNETNYNSLNLTNSIVIPKAISSNKNNIKFYINENDSDNSDATLVSDIGTEENKKVIEVETINLDESLHSYLQDVSYDALVYKSDLQGYDLIAFSEFSLDIINKIELAIIEVYPKYFMNHYGKDSSNQILKLLNSYSKIYIIEGHKVIQIDKNKFLDLSNTYIKDMSVFWNIHTLNLRGYYNITDISPLFNVSVLYLSYSDIKDVG